MSTLQDPTPEKRTEERQAFFFHMLISCGSDRL